MKQLISAIKSMAVKFVVNTLKEKESELAEEIAKKIDIPLIGEAEEKKLARAIISVVSETLETLAKK